MEVIMHPLSGRGTKGKDPLSFIQPPVDATKVTVREDVRKEGVVVRCEEFYRFGMKSNCSVSSILGTGLKANIYWGDRDRKQFTFSAIEGM